MPGHRIAMLVGFAILAGCARFDTYYAEGIPIATRDRDLAQCEAEALVRFPVDIVIRRTPPTLRPPSTTCDAAGACTTTPGHWDWGEAYSVDVNAAARTRAVTGCMGGRGYARITLPACDLRQPPAVATTMPPLAPETCVINRRDGGRIVVTP